jgi:hypothetical protein
VKVINAALLSCLDDMFYRLPFPNQLELEKLIKDVPGGVAKMSDFRDVIREDLNEPRALKDFESGWDAYWNETQTQKRAAANRGQQSKSMRDRIRKATPPTPGDTSGDGENGEDRSLSQTQKPEVPRRLSLLLPVLHSLHSSALSAEHPFHTAGGGR